MIVLSGIAATRRDGTGRLLREFVRERDSKGLDVQFVFLGNRANVLRSQLLVNPLAVAWHAALHQGRRLRRHVLMRQRGFVEASRMMVLHPQEMGMRWLDELISRRSRVGLVTEMFVLDASFFCIRSYNHLDGGVAPCLLCLREGPAAAELHRCRPFPIRDPWAKTFVTRLRDHARSGRVAFWTQTEGYRELLEQFAGASVKARVVGLWTDDFTDLQVRDPVEPPLADVVYHGSWHEAKGARWAVDLAAAMPERTFLFPCRKPAAVAIPPNVTFRPLSWDTGLAEQVQASPLCLVPSLWTAPIEGSLVKSIAWSPATAVIESPQGFATELPEGLVLRLPSDPTAAAERIRGLWPWRPGTQLREQWLRSFTNANAGLLERLFRATPL
jgi:hypothetical protein